MKNLINFFENEDIEKSTIYPHLKCSKNEALILRELSKLYISGNEEVVVADLLINMYGEKNYDYLRRLDAIKRILELGWIVQQVFHQVKIGEFSPLELLNSSVSLSASFLKLIEDGNLDVKLPDIKPYDDHLEYLQDQFFRIEIYQKIAQSRHDYHEKSLGVGRLKNKLKMLEKRIEDRLAVSENEVALEKIYSQHQLDEKEQVIFLALLKEEYSTGETNLREMNALIELISFDEYERIKNRALLEDSARLISEEIIDYDEMLSPFGGITRSFFIVDEVLQNIMHPQKKKKVRKLKLDMLIKEQDMFELIDPATTLDDVVLNKKTSATLKHLLKQMDREVISRLWQWGVKEKRRGMDARIIFYGAPGTGKTMTALSLAKSLKRQVLNFDCSKILSMYVGESEKNVRKIFDTYVELSQKSKSEPILLLNEADQFLGARSAGVSSSADQMHNQMQNIFLEQIEQFQGILIATTNLLENIDIAFSRRFNYKIEFKKPDIKERALLWKKHLPVDAPYIKSFSVDRLAGYKLTGGQIALIVRNTAYKVATYDTPMFTVDEFITEIEKEEAGNFDSEKLVGFLKS